LNSRTKNRKRTLMQ